MTAAPYATADEVRGYESALSSPDDYPDVYLAGLVTEFEEVAEDYIGMAYAVRSTVDTWTLTRPSRVLVLRHRPIVAISAFTVDGTTFAADNYAADLLTGVITYAGWYWRPSVWLGVNPTITVTYTYGNPVPPAGLKRACLEYCRAVALQKTSGVGRDIVYQAMDGMTTRYSSPDKNAGRPTGYIEVDRILNTFKDRAPAVA